MVLLKLSIKAELENVTELQPDSNDFEYFFNVKCTSCNEPHPNIISMNYIEEYEVPGGKHGTANFVWKCGFCKRPSSAKFDTSYKIKPYTSENIQFQPLLVIECRGLELTGFNPKGTWKCVGTTGTVFDTVDLTENYWSDYDEKAALPVSVSDLESEWSRA